MKYVALLRGINVGGNNIIKMITLKTCFEKAGYTNVVTYIQSGNVIFHSDEKNEQKLIAAIEKMLAKNFTYHGRIVLRSHAQMKEILAKMPPEWKTRTDLRCNIAFIKYPVTVTDAFKEVISKEGVDFITVGPSVLYMATLLSKLTQSALPKLISKKIYQDMTIRNYNTTQKLVSLMEENT